MATMFSEEVVKQAMALCDWRKKLHFVVSRELSTKQLTNALTFIAPGVRKEDVVALRDESFTQNGKTGMLLTSDKIYFNGDYRLSTNSNQKYIDLSQVKRLLIRGNGGSWMHLEFSDGTHDMLDCGIYRSQIFQFLSRVIGLYNAGMGAERNLSGSVSKLLNELKFDSMQQILAKYPDFVLGNTLPAKNADALKKLLKNPFMEEIVAFCGTFKPRDQWGVFFSTEYYYFVNDGKVIDSIRLWDLADIHPNPLKDHFTAILKDETVKSVQVGFADSHDLELIFEELRHLDKNTNIQEPPEMQARRARVIQEMHRIRDRACTLPYQHQIPSELIPVYKKLLAEGKTEDLPMICHYIAYRSYPPADSYYHAKSYLYQPLSRYALSHVFYYLFCLRHNVRYCEDKVRCYDNLEYRAFVRQCNETSLEEVREKLRKELDSYRYQHE